MSQLTQWEYWNNFYQDEFETFEHLGHHGEEWFHSDTKCIVKWLCRLEGIDPKTTRVLDVGCGNGLFLVRLAKSGFCDLTGCDYVEHAILLGQRVCQDALVSCVSSSDDDVSNVSDDPSGMHNVADTTRLNERRQAEARIRLAALDITAPFKSHVSPAMSSAISASNDAIQNVRLVSPEDVVAHPYDLIHDKGTFDIFFMRGNPQDYIQAIADSFAHPGSIVCVTSCNATEDELISIWTSYAPAARKTSSLTFSVVATLKHRSFQFGGVVGQVVSTVAFKAIAGT